MSEITVSKNEYLKLQKQAVAYQKLMGRFYESIVKDPIDDVVEDFRKTNLYTDDFLKDLGDGLQKSSYAKRL